MRKNIPYTLSIINDNEKVQYCASITWITLIKPIFALFLFTFFFLIFLEETLSTQELNIFLFLLGPVCFFGSIVQFFKALIYIISTEIVKTNKRIIFKTGFVIRDTIEIPLNQVESVNINQSIVGRIFGFGDAIIIGTGGTQQKIHDVAQVIKFRKSLLL